MKALNQISLEARKIHQQAIVIDLHADTLFLVFRFKYNLAKRHKNPLPASPFIFHVDIPRIKEGGVSSIGFSLPLLSFGFTRKRGSVLESLKRVNQWASEVQGRLRLARNADDILEAREAGLPSFFLTLEGSHGVPDDVDELKEYRRLGLTAITLTHLTPCRAAYPSTLKRWAEHSLPKEGFSLIEKMEAAGIMVDLAHTGRRSFIDAVHACRKPPVVSHTGFYGVRPMWRNISDYEAKRIADKCGVIGVIFAPCFLSRNLFDSIDCVVENIRYLLKLVGDDFISLGSDFDGWIPSVPKMLEDVSQLPFLTDRLLKEGIPADSIKKILGGNALRVIREVCGKEES